MFRGSTRPSAIDVAVRGWAAGAGPIAQRFARWVDAAGNLPFAILATATLCVLCVLCGRRRTAALAVVAPALTIAASSALKPVVGRRIHAGSLCYPSGHTAFVTALALVAMLLLIDVVRIGNPLGIAVVLIGTVTAGATMAIGQIVLDAHYPTDTLGGLFTATAVVPCAAVLVGRVADRNADPATSDPPRPGRFGPSPGTSPRPRRYRRCAGPVSARPMSDPFIEELSMSIKTKAKDGINASLRPLGVQVVRGRTADPGIKTFLSARQTIAAARRAGLSVSDYIDREHAVEGATAKTVDAMLRLAELTGPVDRVCEIGPGSGRYAEKVIAALHPGTYEAYETATDWWPHLRTLENLVTQACDGHTLAATASSSVDLVHAHKVFVYVPFATTVGYLVEMARVVRPGGTVAFDIVSEGCLDDRTVERWAADGTIFLPVPRGWVVDFLAARGLTLLGNEFVPMTSGRTELLVFRKSG